jgi:cytochrome c553
MGIAFVAFLLTHGTAQQDRAGSNPDVERGRYIVHDVCLCTICHSPRGADGRPIEARLLAGGPIPVSSPYRDVEWAFRAPKIAGLPAGWTEEELVAFLQSGEAPHGRAVRAPMPPYRLSEGDAQAVAAYLSSLR